MTVVNNKEKERARKLIEALAENHLSPELHGRLREWFLGVPENGVAEEALAEWAAQNATPDTIAPGRKEKEKFRRLVEMLEKEERGDRAAVSKRRFVPVRRWAWRAAAVLVPVLTAVGGAFLLFHDRAKEGTVLFHAESGGGHETFTLPDGSNVTLEPGSTLAYSGDFVSDRRVDLDGQAFFDVTHDPVHPFSVHHDGFHVAALGTEFHVKAHNHLPEAEIVLVSGSVRVEMGDHRLELLPEQKLVLDKAMLAVVELSQAGPGTLMRVMHHDLKIDKTHVREALAVVADYFDKEFFIEDVLWEDDSLDIVLPHDAPIETAILYLNALTETVKCYVVEDTIRVSGK